MTESQTDPQLELLDRASRRSALLSLIGLIIVFGALIYSSLKLASLQSSISSEKQQQTKLSNEIRELQLKKADLERQAATLVTDLNRREHTPLADTIEPHASSTPLPGIKAKNGLPIYDFVLSISVPENRKQDIQSVDYYFDDPSFIEKVKTSTDGSTGYPVSYRGWGCLTAVKIRVHLKDQKDIVKYFDMCKGLHWT